MVGRDGSILIKDGNGIKTSLDLVEGFKFDSGFASSQFITNERKGTLSFSDPMILVTDQRITTVNQMMQALQLADRAAKPLLIIAEEVEGQALAALIANSLRGTMQVAAINAPFFGEERRNFLNDLALSVNATLVGTTSGDVTLEKIQLKDFGKAKSVESTKNFTTITDGAGDSQKIANKVDSLKDLLKATEDLKECEKIQNRITRLAGGVAIITVGANTEVEMIEKKHRIEDALEAVKSAISDGIIAGGGSALARMSHKFKNEIEYETESHKYGIETVLKACQEPLRIIIENSGGKPDLILKEIVDTGDDMCYDAVNEQMINAFEAGIIDPARVTRTALLNASSAAGTLLTSSHAIIQTE